MLYNKPAITIQQQIDQLKHRGLIIADEAFAAKLLRNISYYRLAGYWWPMQADKVNHIFKPHSTFENIIAIYNFDKELRLLLFDVIERIEIGFRTKLIYHLSHELSPWWFENVAHFDFLIGDRVKVKTLFLILACRIFWGTYSIFRLKEPNSKWR